MKKRIEKVVEWTKSSHKHLTHLKKYNVQSEYAEYYLVINDLGGLSSWFKEDFRVVSEREVLEFEFEGLSCYETLPNIYATGFESEIDLTKYNIKVIATPKEKYIEYWKNNAEENYITTPISVLKYIGKLEKLLKEKE